MEEVFKRAQKSYIYGTCAAGRYNPALGRPLYLQHADGAYLYDVEGNKWIEFNSSGGAAFFGYNHPRIRKAIEKSLEMGFFMNFESEYHKAISDLTL